jgi:uncharacterized protein (DUF58 family)
MQNKSSNFIPDFFTNSTFTALKKFSFSKKFSRQNIHNGRHLSEQRGFGIEFADYRSYEQGDHPKYIDWYHYARSDKLYVKRFNESTAYSISLIVDTSTSMIHRLYPEKWLYCKEIILSLAFIALNSYEHFRIIISPIDNPKRITGKESFINICKKLAYTTSSSKETHPQAILNCIKTARNGELIILVSDFLDDPSNLIPKLKLMRRKKLSCIGIQILSELDLNPFVFNSTMSLIDSESGEKIIINSNNEIKEEYKKRLHEHQKKLSEIFTEYGSLFIYATSKVDTITFINESLYRSGILV